MKTKLFSLAVLASSLVSAQAWNVTGNSGTNSSTNFVGTTDSQQLILKSNNIEGLRVLPDGNVRIGGNIDPVTNNSTLRVYRDFIPTIELANPFGRFEISKSACNGCSASGAVPGDTVLRNLSGSHNIIISMPNNNNDGSSYIGINDATHGTWIKFLNNAIAKFDGKIYAREIEVKANVWADYVFKKDYKLRTLEEVENHIAEKGHLPNIPSAAEVEKNGINLGEMDAKLLEKIEELTLYSIKQNKQIKQLQEENKVLKSQSEEIKELKKQVQELISAKK